MLRCVGEYAMADPEAGPLRLPYVCDECGSRWSQTWGNQALDFTAEPCNQANCGGRFVLDRSQDPNYRVVVPPHLTPVLVVDDDIIAQKVLAVMLAGMGYPVTCVSSGMAALESLARQSADIVFMDIVMPGWDGLETTRQIQALSGHSVYIVAVTADDSAQMREKCTRVGMKDYMTKPLHLEKLKRVLAARSQVPP